MATRKLPTRSKEPPPKSTKKPSNLGTKKKDDNKKKSPQQKINDAARAAEKRAVARAKADKKKAGKRYLEGAANLSPQAKAIRQALDIDLASARDNNLGDISRTLTAQLQSLQSDAGVRARQFLTAATDTEKATADTAESGISNAFRERADSLGAILEQGAGETDTARAMLMAARNWQSNASDANRAYFDTINTVNSSITDMNVDTKNAMNQQWTGAEAAKDEVWQTFYNNRGQAFTQLGNVLGQQADLYAQAKEMGVKPKKGAEKKAEDAMKKAFKDAAVETGKGYTQQTAPESISGYQGQELVKARQGNSNLAAAMTFDEVAKAEGATLRKWAS